MTTFGSLNLDAESGKWVISAQPHVLMRLRRLFESSKTSGSQVMLDDTPDRAADLEWFVVRYPLEMNDETRAKLQSRTREFAERSARLEQIMRPEYKPCAAKLAVPARDYQLRAAEVYQARGSLLLGDDLGLGKTCSAICSLVEGKFLPAVVVCYPHLQRQWLRELAKFLPRLRGHIVKKTSLYEFPVIGGRGPDVIIISYSKLADWADHLATFAKSVIFDEAQELRRRESSKWLAAKRLAESVVGRMGLTATPIYNYGGEMFNVLDVLSPGSLGTFEEFYREWCQGFKDKASIRDPRAFGSYLRENFTMLRRTRADVGRELPDVVRVIHEVDADAEKLAEVADQATELAKLILGRVALGRGEKMQASEQFTNLLRQATGIAKAPYVAEFVSMLVHQGDEKRERRPVVLSGWHRAVYDLWESRLKRAGLRVTRYTGSESQNQKDEAIRGFVSGAFDVFMLSNRAGAGINGLQEVCNTLVVGELDWSNGVHEQLIGRLNRDGSIGGVTAYFPISDHGCDPVMVEVLGLKREQSIGICDPTKEDMLERLETEGVHVKKLAEQFLKRYGRKAA